MTMEIVLGNLYYDGKGHFVRHFSYGYCCSCGGKPDNHCQHIKAVKKELETEEGKQ